ncbi:DUF2513 domain-containing protein [Mitsuokella sp.]|uniref:DUF2513 domain-containing protein n=1 Tax=Mitsuokella sp. TaxID=2049034 RepID=UPI003D7D7C36
MKRDLDLMRNILLRIEAFDPKCGHAIRLLTFKDLCDDLPMLSLQIELLIDAGFIEVDSEIALDDYTKDFIISRITFAGYEYLDSVRNDTIWESVKKRLASIGGEASIDIVKSLASSMLLKQLGL